MDKKARVPTSLVKGMKGDDKDTFIKNYLAVAHVTDKIKEVLQADVETTLRPRKSDYDIAGWAYKQAHLNGIVEGIEKAIKLLP